MITPIPLRELLFLPSAGQAKEDTPDWATPLSFVAAWTRSSLRHCSLDWLMEVA